MKLLNLTLLLLALVGCTACGEDDSCKIKAEDQDQSSFNQCLDSTKKKYKADDKETQSEDQLESETSEAQSVKIKKPEPKEEELAEDEEIIRFVILDKKMDWQEAVTSAPAGYKLPSLDELTVLIDDYEIVITKDDGSPLTDAIWTRDTEDETYAWVVSLSNNRVYSSNEITQYTALYISSSFEVEPSE